MPQSKQVNEKVSAQRAEELLQCNRQLAIELQQCKMSNAQYRSEINRLRSQLSDKVLHNEQSSSATERGKPGKSQRNDRSKLKPIDENSIRTPAGPAKLDSVNSSAATNSRQAFTPISGNTRNSRALTPKPDAVRIVRETYFSNNQENIGESANTGEANDSFPFRPRRQAAPTAGSMKERNLTVKLRRS